jgi:transcriptional regulator with XRE-family HTH domain
MVLLRHLLGDALRRLRLRQGRTLREVSAAARVSLGYLSEVERGQKEASSELLAAICTALGTPLSQLLREVSDNFALAELQSEPVFTGISEPAVDLPGRAVSEGAGGELPVAPVASAAVRSAGPAMVRIGREVPGLKARAGDLIGPGSAPVLNAPAQPVSALVTRLDPDFGSMVPV